MLQALSSDFLFAILAFGIILIPAIIIHELGHFLTAKLIGINVLEFGIGFPPRIARLFNWGETEFTLNWLPLGGFVRPLGEDMVGPVDTSADETDEQKPKNAAYLSEREELIARGVPEDELLSVNEAKPVDRIFFMSGGALANVISAALFFMIAALFGVREIVGARLQVVETPNTSVFAGTEFEEGDWIEKVNGDYFQSPSDFFDVWMSLSGTDDMVDLQMRDLDTQEQYEITIPAPESTAVESGVIVTVVVEDSPADDAGLQPDDLIVQINGRALSRMNPIDDLQETTTELAGTPIELIIRRDGSEQVITLTPRANPPAGEGRIGIGILARYATDDEVVFYESNPQQEFIPRSLIPAIEYGFKQTSEIIGLIFSIPAQLIEGAISPEEARPVSIVGISQIGGNVVQQSVDARNPSIALEFMAMISIFLGITNLLPLPPLDGGRIVFVIIEMVRGKPVPIHIENAVYRIGIILLLTLGVLVILYDIINPLTLSS